MPKRQGLPSSTRDERQLNAVAEQKSLSSFTPERRPNSASEQQGLPPSAPKRQPNVVTMQKGLPSSNPERPPNVLNIVRKQAPPDYQTPSADRGRKRQRTSDNAGAPEDTNERQPNRKLTPFTMGLQKAMPKKAEAVILAQLSSTRAK